MQVILIEPGKEPVMIEVNPDDRVSEVIGGEPVIQALPNLRMELFTNGEADRQGLAETGALNLGAVSIRVKGKAIVLRPPVEDEVNAENEYGLTFPDVRPCDLALIRACWVPAVERLEERSRRECDYGKGSANTDGLEDAVLLEALGPHPLRICTPRPTRPRRGKRRE